MTVLVQQNVCLYALFCKAAVCLYAALAHVVVFACQGTVGDIRRITLVTRLKHSFVHHLASWKVQCIVTRFETLQAAGVAAAEVVAAIITLNIVGSLTAKKSGVKAYGKR